MALLIETQPVPLTINADGVVRVGNTRVTLDTVIAAFLKGATAEEIAHQYPSLSLPDIYSVIGYYLKNRYEVDKYLATRKKQSQAIREQTEKKYDPVGIRERLIMSTYHVETTVSKDGKLSIQGLPFHPGEKVEVTVRGAKKNTANRYSLRGKPVRYEKPFEGAAEGDWEVLK